MVVAVLGGFGGVVPSPVAEGFVANYAFGGFADRVWGCVSWGCVDGDGKGISRAQTDVPGVAGCYVCNGDCN